MYSFAPKESFSFPVYHQIWRRRYGNEGVDMTSYSLEQWWRDDVVFLKKMFPTCEMIQYLNKLVKII